MARLTKEDIMEQVTARLAERGMEASFAAPGLPADEMMSAMEHPLAMGEVDKIMERETTSVQPGDPAPDFCLDRLDGGGEQVRLSDHFGKRPVALIFGSYT